MKSSKKSRTASELMKSLQKDSEWVRQNAERQAKLKALERQFEAEEKPIVDDLAKAGCRVKSVYDLVNSKVSYPGAIPVLLNHLRQPYHPKIREGIIRALTVRESRGAPAREILEMLKRQDFETPGEMPPGVLRWALANALTVAADASMVDELKALNADPHYQDVHERINVALKKLRDRT